LIIINIKQIFEFYFKCYAKKVGEDIYEYYPNKLNCMKLYIPDKEVLKKISNFRKNDIESFLKKVFNITEEEKNTVIRTYFDNTNELRLKNFPAKEKKKIIVLQEITNLFNKTKRYTESEINQIIGSVYDDFATIRRYLIEYGFMDRTQNCSEYWVK
jgi:hypothetical protein